MSKRSRSERKRTARVAVQRMPSAGPAPAIGKAVDESIVKGQCTATMLPRLAVPRMAPIGYREEGTGSYKDRLPLRKDQPFAASVRSAGPFRTSTGFDSIRPNI